MSYIYKITNDINQKIYIGKTDFSIEKRFKEHCKDAFRDKNEKRPLYSAMRKYGVENFHIELVEECPQEEVDKKEIYWIGFYKSFSNGYNATLGGDGKAFYNHEAIINRLKECPYPVLVAEEFGCCTDTVLNIAKANNIIVKNLSNDKLKSASKIVYQYSKDGQLLNSFSSTIEAAKWCFENGHCKTLASGVRSHISDVCNGKRKSAYGYIWTY